MSPLLHKILRIAGKVIFWILVVYLVLGFILIPLAATWTIRTQGAKYINHNVRVKSVRINPLSLSLSVNGLEIMDDDNKKPMVVLQRFFVNVSFMSLFKKIYRVEDITVDGLKVHAALLTDGSINLMHLVPKEPPKQPDQPSAQNPSGVTQDSKSKEIPVVIVDKIAVKNSDVFFADLNVSPNFQTSLNQIMISVLGLTTDPSCLVKVAFQALLDAKGKMAVETQVKPFVQPLEMETILTLDQYVMNVLSPYVGKFTGRELAGGRMDFQMIYRISNNQLTASHKLLIQHFEFGNKVDSKDALGLPFGLAVALLEDPQGRIVISLPVKGDLSDPEFEYWPLVGQVVRNFFIKLVTKPFSILASVVAGGDSGTEEMGYVRFIPGKAEISAEDQEKLKLIVAGLTQRPKLSLEINGSYDPDVDWKAIKTQVFEKDYTDLKGESTKLESWVYRTLYQRRFGVRALFKLINQYQRRKEDIADNPELNAEIKRQLIEDAPPDKLALDVLAQSRAKMIYDYILSTGFDPNRLTIGGNRSTQSTMGLIPLEFTLTVYGEQPASSLPKTTDPAVAPLTSENKE